MLKKHKLNCDGGATVVRAPSIKEETQMVKTNASTVIPRLTSDPANEFFG
jgi:hypothetical protein